MRARVVAMMVVCFITALGLQARLPIPDFGQPPDLADNLQASLHLSVDVWKLPFGDANRIAMEPHVTADDFMVAAFLCNRSGKSLPAVWELRRSGLPWGQVAVRLGVPWDVIVVEPARDYGPPYGKAWGYWKNHGHGKGRPRQEAFALSDQEFIAMARVHTLAQATGRPPDEIISGLQGGRDYHTWCGEVYREKHGQGHGPKHKGAKGHDAEDNLPPGLQNKEHGGEGHGHGHEH